MPHNVDAVLAFADAELASSPVVRRYETSFVKKEIKNRPFIRLDERDAPIRIEKTGRGRFRLLVDGMLQLEEVETDR